MITTNHPAQPNVRPRATRTLAVRAAATMAAAGLLLAVTACSSDNDAAPPTTPKPTEAPTTPPLPSTPAPPATTPPPTTAPVNEARRAQLAGILDAHHAAGEFVGARIALREPDGTITEATSGTPTVDPTSGPVDLDLPWNIGSATKTFVAVVVLQLADEGRIDLDAPIDGYVPDLPGADQMTTRQLLQHTTGLGEYINDPKVRGDLLRKWTPAELVAVAEAAGRVGEPGGPHHYSNTNYILLGEIIEQVTGHSWSDEVRTRIAEPLGMTRTSVLTDERPVGYVLVDGAFIDATSIADPSVGGAAGALQSTGRDLLRFATALAGGALLSPASQAAMQTFVPAEDYSQFGIDHGYGLGIERYVSNAITVIGHMGTGEAQSAYIGWDPDHGTSIAVMTNTAVPGPQAIMAVEALTAVSGAG